MAKRTRTLRHRGYLFAQSHLKRFEDTIIAGAPYDGQNMRENISRRRMIVGEAWRAGYLAAQNDVRRKKV